MQFTKKQLIARARRVSEINDRHIAAAPDASGLAMDNALFEIALAALTAEPVYFVEIEGDQDINAGRVTEGKRPDLGLLPDGINHLYAAPPAPVVPDGVLNSLEHEANHVTDWHHMDEHSCKVNRRDLLTLVNACRAAMQPKDGK